MGWQGFTDRNNGFYFPETSHIACNATIYTARGCSNDWSSMRTIDGLYQLTALTYIIRFFIWGFIIIVSI